MTIAGRNQEIRAGCGTTVPYLRPVSVVGRATRVRFDELAQRSADAGDDAAPVTRGRLTEQPGGAVPRAVLASAQPAPAGIEAIEHPHRLAQRSGEMRNRRVHADHQVECRNQRRRVGKIVQVVGEIMHR